MRPAARLLFAAAGLGLASSILIAWALAAWLPLHNVKARDIAFSVGDVECIGVEVSREGLLRRAFFVPQPGVSYLDFAGGLLRSVAAPDFNQPIAPARELPVPTIQLVQTTHEGIQDARGWPALCLYCTVYPKFRGFVSLSTPLGSTDGILLRQWLPGADSDLADARALPLRPLWRGLALNTAFYSLLWLVSLAAAKGTVRSLRLRRNHCPHCNYDLSATPTTCPECGWKRSTC